MAEVEGKNWVGLGTVTWRNMEIEPNLQPNLSGVMILGFRVFMNFPVFLLLMEMNPQFFLPDS
eukprot:snap_masked-scaffold_35-processed-gene-2.48-mRNA-1 protein AED:1.00 eAED:1.00 QI:0/0/0/0/1/1/2/0/62